MRRGCQQSFGCAIKMTMQLMSERIVKHRDGAKQVFGLTVLCVFLNFCIVAQYFIEPSIENLVRANLFTQLFLGK